MLYRQRLSHKSRVRSFLAPCFVMYGWPRRDKIHCGHVLCQFRLVKVVCVGFWSQSRCCRVDDLWPLVMKHQCLSVDYLACIVFSFCSTSSASTCTVQWRVCGKRAWMLLSCFCPRTLLLLDVSISISRRCNLCLLIVSSARVMTCVWVLLAKHERLRWY